MKLEPEIVTVRGTKGALVADEYERSNPSKAVISTRPAGGGALELTVVPRYSPGSMVRLSFLWADGRQDVRFVRAREAAEITTAYADSEKRAREGLLELNAVTVRREAGL